MWWSSGDGRIELRITKDEAASGSHQGQCDDDIEALSKVPRIKRQLDKLSPTLVRDELRGCGFEDDKLDDDDMNLQRLLWLACGDIVDEQCRA